LDICISDVEGGGEDSSTSANVAIGICVPVIIILIGLIIGYCIYIKRNPDGYGRSTTYKHMGLYFR